MRNRLGIIALAAAAASGCLQKETTHTLYLSPAGEVSWTAVEKDVYSDTADPVTRFGEEQEYITAAGAGTHDVGRALAVLSPSPVRTRIIRAERPFMVITQVESVSVDALIRELLRQSHVDGQVEVAHDGPVRTLAVRINVATTRENWEREDGSENLLAGLYEELDRYRIVLTEGRFTSARGFRLNSGGTEAVPVETPWSEIEANNGVFEMSLSWMRR